MNRYHFHNVEKRVISDSFFRLQQTYLIRLKSAKNNDPISFYSVSRNLMHQDSEFHMASAQAFLRQCLQNHPDNYPAVYDTLSTPAASVL